MSPHADQELVYAPRSSKGFIRCAVRPKAVRQEAAQVLLVYADAR
ncbi:hypothetical protein [Streptomyces murinus]